MRFKMKKQRSAFSSELAAVGRGGALGCAPFICSALDRSIIQISSYYNSEGRNKCPESALHF